MFRAYIRYEREANTHKLQRVLFFIFDLRFLLFLILATFIIITFPSFLLSHSLCIYGPGIYRQKFSVGFQSPVSHTTWF